LNQFIKDLATTDLKLDKPGSLPRPGPVGRVVRLLLGLLCLWQVSGLIHVTGNFFNSDNHIKDVVWNGIVIGLVLVSYVVNIGFSKAWKKWPAIISAVAFLLISVFGYLTQGVIETSQLAWTLWVWEFYVYLHLGLAFIVSGLIGSAGCEMRSFHALYSRIAGNQTKEHVCAIGPLHPIDQWEARRFNT
jgi:uncharacterized integral membrane protein